jgi:hypothetical protein
MQAPLRGIASDCADQVQAFFDTLSKAKPGSRLCIAEWGCLRLERLRHPRHRDRWPEMRDLAHQPHWADVPGRVCKWDRGKAVVRRCWQSCVVMRVSNHTIDVPCMSKPFLTRTTQQPDQDKLRSQNTSGGRRITPGFSAASHFEHGSGPR